MLLHGNCLTLKDGGYILRVASDPRVFTSRISNFARATQTVQSKDSNPVLPDSNSHTGASAGGNSAAITQHQWEGTGSSIGNGQREGFGTS